MKDPARAAAIVRETVRAVRLPVTVKIRLGWDEAHKNAPELAKRLEDAGAAMITVHGRTRTQMYSGNADLSGIAAVVRAVSIPVVGNGDVRDGEGARRMLSETGCAGLMIARGAIGNPYVFAEIAAMMEGRDFTPPPLSERLSFALWQLETAAEEKGERTAVAESRKQLAEVIRGTRGAAALRGKINQANTLDEIRAILSVLPDLA